MSALESIARLRQQAAHIGHLFDQKIWMCSGGTNAAGKADKAPKDYRRPWKHGKSNDADTWGTLNQIEDAARKYPRLIDHIGIASGPWARVLDWDHKPHAEQPLIVETQAGLFSHCYQEISLSGRGLRCLILAPALDFKKQSFDLEPGVELEVFASHQYAILTGNTTNPAGVMDASQELSDLLALLAPEPAVKVPPISYAPRAYSGDSDDLYVAADAAWNLHDYLESRGYARKFADRHLYPASETGAPGVVVQRREDGRLRCFSNHKSDPLANGHWNDAFDTFTLLEHGGDYKAAAREARRLLGLERAKPAGPDLERVKAAWAEQGDELVGRMIQALDQTTMHHHARKASVDLLANIYMKAMDGNLQIVQGQVCVMVGGMNGLAAELGGRPNDASSRLRLMASHGFLGQFRHSDPTDKRSSLMIVVPGNPFDLPFLKLTQELLHALNLRPDTVDSRRSNSRKQRTPPVQSTVEATPTGGVRQRKDKNPLQDAMRVALVLSHQPSLTLRQIAKAARCQTATARKHLAVLESAGLVQGTRLLVSFQQYFQAARAAVAERTAARLKGFLELSEKYAEHSLRLARFGVAECQRTAPARRRLLLRSRELLNSFTPAEVAA